MPHEHNIGAGKEHPKTHQIIFGSVLMYISVNVIDYFIIMFFPSYISAQLTVVIPLFVRTILFAIVLVMAITFMKLSHKSVFGEEEVKSLKKTGIFAHVRNPMYLGTPLICIAFLLLTMSLVSIIPLIIIFILFTHMVKFEEKELEKVFGQEYLEYKEKVPRWLPRLTPVKFND